MFGYVAASPDKSYLIAVGLRQGKNTKTFHRWVVKIDANTGKTIWEFSMPSTDTRAGKHSGYESVVFTEDGGFIAGGFAQVGTLKCSESHENFIMKYSNKCEFL